MLEKLKQIKFDDNSIEDFIPIACHFDERTLLTKNGELVQIIKVLGVEKSIEDYKIEDIRNSIRQSILKHIKSNKYSIAFHVVRERQDVNKNKINDPEGFCSNITDMWQKKHNWSKQLDNCLYISITRQHAKQEEKAFSFFPELFYKKRLKAVESIVPEITEVVESIREDLDVFDSKILQMHKKDDVYISEPLSFYFYLINLYPQEVPVPVKDYSEYLAGVKLEAYGNYLKIGEGDKTRYAAVYSFKEPYNIEDARYYSELLNLGSQYILTENIHFVHHSVINKEYKKINDIQNGGIDGDTNARLLWADSRAILESNGGEETDYCVQQVTMTIYSDDFSFFEKKNEMFNEVANSKGIVCVREDYAMSKLFWSNLPGNTKYICRKFYNSSYNMGPFNSLHDADEGSYIGSKWGYPIAKFRTMAGRPYYFNFHNPDQVSGHTLVIGPQDTGKSVLINFFLARSMKFEPKVFYIDLKGRAEKIVDKFEGTYIDILPGEESPISCNIFDLKYFNDDRKLFSSWLMSILFPGAEENEQFVSFCSTLSEKLFEKDMTGEERFKLAKEILKSTEDRAVIANFNKVLGPKLYNYFFKEDLNEILEIEGVTGLNLSKFKKDMFFKTYLSLLLIKLSHVADGQPTMIIINDAENIFDCKILSQQYEKWLKTLNDKNAIAILSIDDSSEVHNTESFKKGLPHVATKVFLSDKFANKNFSRIFDLSNKELYHIKNYDIKRRMFLLKQQGTSIVASFNMDDNPEFIDELS